MKDKVRITAATQPCIKNSGFEARGVILMLKMKFIAAVLLGLLVGGMAAAAPPQQVPAAPKIIPAEIDRGCVDGKDNRASELCAQWAAVDAARLAVKSAEVANDLSRSSEKAAWYGAFFALITTVLLIWTFALTVKSTDASVKSANAAMATLDAEKAMVELVEATAILDLKMLDDRLMDSASVDFIVRWKNLGKRIALETAAVAEVHGTDWEGGLKMKFNLPKPVKRVELEANDDIEMKVCIRTGTVCKFLRRSAVVYLTTHVSYRDRMHIAEPYQTQLTFKLVRPQSLKIVKTGRFDMVLEPITAGKETVRHRVYLWAFPIWARLLGWIDRRNRHLPVSRPKRH